MESSHSHQKEKDKEREEHKLSSMPNLSKRLKKKTPRWGKQTTNEVYYNCCVF